MSVSDKRVRTKRETNDSFRKNNKPDAAGKGNSGDTEKETGNCIPVSSIRSKL